MRRELIVKSKSLSGTSDLTLLAPIRVGLVPSLDTVTHKTRIKRLLQTLGAGRSSSQEYALLRPFSDAVERVGKIHSVRVAVLEPENKVMLAVTFDGSWESYIRVLWQKVGTLLDIIFFDTEGHVSAYDNRFEEWEAWCRRVQVETHFFYGTPQLTVDDVRYLKHEELCHRRRPGQPKADLDATRYSVRSAEQLSWLAAAQTSGHTSLETLKQGCEALAALYRLADLYLPATEDGLYLRRAARDLLLEFVTMLEGDEFPVSLLAPLRQRFNRQLIWITDKPPKAKDRLRTSPPLPDVLPEFDRADVQGGIVHPYEGITHGCLLLLAIRDRGRAVAFFRRLLLEVTADKASLLAGELAVNVAFTYEGMRAVGLSEDELAMLPEEFREGMELRAGALGDVRSNHPRRWTLPRRFDDASPNPARVELSAAHVLLQLRAKGPLRDTAPTSDTDYLDKHFKAWNKVTVEGAGMQVLSVQPMDRLHRGAAKKVVEHFGFADGDSDPVIDPSLTGETYSNQVRLGEILFGYDNEADSPPDPEKSSDPATARARLEWLRNGSFLVVRKLAQDVPAFHKALVDAAIRLEVEQPGTTPDLIAAKMMGRGWDGRSLVDGVPSERPNDFDYSGDEQGTRCPFHAHVRRSNPRAPAVGLNEPEGRRTPRILRRGMSYGAAVASVVAEGGPNVNATSENDAADRGLVFMAYNASIAEQFEIVQRWISGGNASGGFSGQSDPFLGVPDNGGRRAFRFELGPETKTGPDKKEDSRGRVVSVELDGSDDALGERRPFVRLEWGAYLFAPSLTALRRLAGKLAASPPGREPAWSAREGLALIARLRDLEASTPDIAVDAWKAALEDSVEVEKFRSASIWAAIREHHSGALRTPYGVLVADRTLAMKVLRDGVTYSVSGYAKRLDKSIGPIYLGKDDGEEYRELCMPVNNAIMAITRQQAFEMAHAATTKVMVGLLTRASLKLINPVHPSRWELTCEIREIIDPVLGAICQSWFGLPAEGGKKQENADIRLEGSRWDAEPRRALYPGHFTAPSRYVFQPRPGPSAERFGCDYGNTITAAFTRFLQASIDSGKPWPVEPRGKSAPIARAIWKAFGLRKPLDLGLVARTLVGAMMGFLPTVDGNLRRSLNEWLYEGTFWSLREQWQRSPGHALQDAERVLAPALRDAMLLRPSPELVWRTATTEQKLGPVEVEAGDIVVVGIVSASQQCLAAGDRDDYLLFGGNRREVEPAPPTHACPAYEAATGVLLGFIAALLQVKVSMRPSAVPLALTFDGVLGDFAGSDPALVKAMEEDEQRAAIQEAAESTSALAKRTASRPAPRSGVAPPPTPPPPRREPRPGPELVIGLGDSWFHYFAIDIFDVLNDKHRYRAVTLAEEGEGLLSISRNPAQLLRLAETLEDAVRRNDPPRAILISAGGNDVVLESLEKLLSKPSAQSELDEALVSDFVDVQMGVALNGIIEKIDALCTTHLGQTLPVLLHGYDYPYPDGRGTLARGQGDWLKPAFEAKGYTSEQFPRAVAAMRKLIDRLNEMQANVAGSFGPRVSRIELRGTLTSTLYTLDWGNELHPTPDGFVRLAATVAEHIRRVIHAEGKEPHPRGYPSGSIDEPVALGTAPICPFNPGPV